MDIKGYNFLEHWLMNLFTKQFNIDKNSLSDEEKILYEDRLN